MNNRITWTRKTQDMYSEDNASVAELNSEADATLIDI